MLVMWAQANLFAPQLIEIRFVPEGQRKAQCPIKYRTWPTDAALHEIVRKEAAKAKA
jgi:hypothetical protein